MNPAFSEETQVSPPPKRYTCLPLTAHLTWGVDPPLDLYRSCVKSLWYTEQQNRIPPPPNFASTAVSQRRTRTVLTICCFACALSCCPATDTISIRTRTVCICHVIVGRTPCCRCPSYSPGCCHTQPGGNGINAKAATQHNMQCGSQHSAAQHSMTYVSLDAIHPSTHQARRSANARQTG